MVTVTVTSACPGYLAKGGEYTRTTALLSEGFILAAILRPYFTATGKDIYVYKTDGNNGNTIQYEAAEWSCLVEGDNFVSAEDSKLTSWRLPTAYELTALQNIHSSLSSQTTSASGTTNFQSSAYWSSTVAYDNQRWTWRFNSQDAYYIIRTTNTIWVRCVRTM